MRPLRLQMQAFGPYAGHQVLDFADLKGRRFFLIHGPTGSGKTTVLDAMAFALYGDTSGAERDAADMRSDQAAADILTEVSFDFAIGADRYRAWRRPAQERPKLRGEGFTTELQDATLWRLESAADPRKGTDFVTAGKPLAAGWSKVTAKAAEILGFRAEQFRQVVMLPQGRFQELLKADSAGRADILATLFNTQYYARLERDLKEAAAVARKALDRVVQEQGFVLTAAGLDSEADVRPAREEAEEAFARACEERARRDESRAEAEAAESAAAEVTAKLTAAAEAESLLRALEAKQPEILRLREEEREARAAAAAAPAGQRAQDCAAAHTQAALALADASVARDDAASAHERARKALLGEESRVVERADAERRAAELEALRGKIGPLTIAQKELEQAHADHERALQTARETRGVQEGVVATHAAAAEALQSGAATAAGAENQASLAGSARDTAADRAKLELLATRLAQAERLCREADERRHNADEQWRRAGDRAAAIERAWSAGQAAVLARALEPGAPCPVCGSTEHPAPAAADTSAPGSDELATAREAVVTALAARDRARAEHAEASASHKTLLAGVETLTDRLGAHAARSPQECADHAEAVAALATSCRDAADSLPALEAALRAAGEAVDVADRHVVAAQAAVDVADRRVARSAATVEERAAALPDGLNDLDTLEREIAAATATAVALAAAHADALAAEHQAAVSLSGAQAALTAAQSAGQAAATAAAAAAAAFDGALAAHGFVDDRGTADPAAWRAAVRADDELSAIVAAVRAFDDELATARGRAEHAAHAAAGLEAPDLVVLRSRSAQARAVAASAAAGATELHVRLESLAATAARLATLHRENESLDVRHTVVGHLAKLANGDNPRGLTLQRFVLGALLDAVLVAATARLLSMSKGRYRLLRTDERRGGRRAAGLDMDVYDAWTGKSRPVSTLSGGESFLAALSLALGLAETVQARTGGIFLDTVFIDEGFGTLDDEALDLAIATLMQLQEGDRLVGIISHVADLKERIDARLEVSAERGASRARFVVP